MVENYSKYKNEIRPVAKEPKSLELVEKSVDRVVFGFEATGEEIAQFFSQTYTSGDQQVEMFRRSGVLYPIYKFSLLAEPVYNQSGKWFLNGDFDGYEFVVAGLSETGMTVFTYLSDFMGLEKDLFHFFGLDLCSEIKRIKPLVKEILNSTKKEIDQAVDLENSKYIVDVEVVISELSLVGNRLIDAARRQSSWLNGLLKPKNGKMVVTVWDSSDNPTDDIFTVDIKSQLSWRERCLTYGMNGLEKQDISHMGQHGAPIPTEAYLDKMEEMWEDTLSAGGYRSMFVSRQSVEAYLHGELTGAEIINKFAEEIQLFCKEGQFELA